MRGAGAHAATGGMRTNPPASALRAGPEGRAAALSACRKPRASGDQSSTSPRPGEIVRVLEDVRLTAEDVPEGCDFRAGRHPLPCWSRRNHRELRSWWRGRERPDPGPARTGPVRDSGPYPGSMHDMAARAPPDRSTGWTPPDGSPTRDALDGG